MKPGLEALDVRAAGLQRLAVDNLPYPHDVEEGYGHRTPEVVVRGTTKLFDLRDGD